MSRRAVTPYLVATVTGIVSGVYIFKPLLEEAAARRKSEEESRATIPSQPQEPSPPPIPDTKATAVENKTETTKPS